MDPVALTALLQSGGPWAIVAVLCGVIVKLWSDLRTETKEHLEDTKSANAAVYAALKTVDTVLDKLPAGGRR